MRSDATPMRSPTTTAHSRPIPASAQALNNRGLALHRLDRLDEALVSYDQALTIIPNYAGAINNRAATFHRLRRHDDALTACDRALAIDPNHREAWSNRGLNSVRAWALR